MLVLGRKNINRAPPIYYFSSTFAKANYTLVIIKNFLPEQIEIVSSDYYDEKCRQIDTKTNKSKRKEPNPRKCDTTWNKMLTEESIKYSITLSRFRMYKI